MRISIINVKVVIFVMHLWHNVQAEGSANANDDAKTITSFCSGRKHSCAVFNSKQMKCIGELRAFGMSDDFYDIFGDEYSELGTNLPYVNVTNNANIDKVSCGEYHVCVKLDTRDMKCIGRNGGEIGIGVNTFGIGAISGYVGDDLPAVRLGTGIKVLDLALGNQFSCALVSGNQVKCFGGKNNSGQLGYEDTKRRGTSPSDMGNNLPFVKLGAQVQVMSIHSASSASHTCVILSAPTASAQRFKCWGLNKSFQLGYSDKNNRGDDANEMGDLLPFVDLGIESKVKQLALGSQHTCALLVNNDLKCWGSGYFGQLASGSTEDIKIKGNSVSSVLLDSGKTVKFITAGQYHTCIVYDDMITAKCVGANMNGHLGQGDTLQRGDTPTTMIPSIPNIDLGTGTLGINSIYSGDYFNCVLFVDSSVKCFGGNWYGIFAIGHRYNVGDQPNEMGKNLKFSNFVDTPTVKPTNAPVKMPTNTPTSKPTQDCSLTDEETCEDKKMCVWKVINGKGTCKPFDCSSFASRASCMQNRKCKWVKSTCKFLYNSCN